MHRLHDQVCASGGSGMDNALLLPQQYSFQAASTRWTSICRLFEPDFSEALAFGAVLPESGAAWGCGRLLLSGPPQLLPGHCTGGAGTGSKVLGCIAPPAPPAGTVAFPYSPTWTVYEGVRSDGTLGERCARGPPALTLRVAPANQAPP